MYVLREEEYKRYKTLDNITNNTPLPPPSLESKVLETAIRAAPAPPPILEIVPPTPTYDVSKKKFSCSICFKSYKNKRDLRRHVKIHNIPAAVTATLQPVAATTNQLNDGGGKKNLKLHKRKK